MNKQPIDTFEWVDVEKLKSNDYNPNHVPPPELQLLKKSILTDGWTQPIVVRPNYEIVDGFHRWTLALRDDEVREFSNNKVPVVFLKEVKREEQMASTVRHNRARGNHAILGMSDLVQELIDERGLNKEDVMDLLEMEYEEVDRLYDKSGMIGRASKDDFNRGWQPGD